MMQVRFAFCLLAALLTAAACPSNSDNGNPAPAPAGNRAVVYTTNTSGLRFQESHVTVEAATNDPFTVTLTGETFQTVEGFGFAITQATCYNLLQMPAGAWLFVDPGVHRWLRFFTRRVYVV